MKVGFIGLGRMGGHMCSNVIKAGFETYVSDLVPALVEQKGSAPIYPLLKRADEKYVTGEAYVHPKFVEDILRDVVLALRDLPGIAHFSVACEHFESIHNHNDYASHEEPVSL